MLLRMRSWFSSCPSLDTGEKPSPREMLIFLGIFVLAWTIYNTVIHAVVGLNHDMTEAYVWGREFQLGYYKHPPLWAWISGVWFLVLPHKNWAFALLSALNAAVGLYGVWKLNGLFSTGRKRLAATLLLLVTPFYTFYAFKYNANSIFLSLWPWTAYMFIRAVTSAQTQHWPRYALALGALAACDMLSKYYAVILLASCFAAALTHKQGRAYLRSPSPYVSVVIAAILFAPHLWWLWHHNFLPFHYFASETGNGILFSMNQAALLTLACLAGNALVIGLIAWAGGTRFADWEQTLRDKWSSPRFRELTVLALLPYVLTIVASLVFSLRLSSNTTIAVFCLAPLLLVELAGRIDETRLVRRTAGFAAVLMLGALIISPAVNYADKRMTAYSKNDESDLRTKLARKATRLWHVKTGTQLAYVAGDGSDADAIAFYSPDHPAAFIDFDYSLAPWVKPKDIARSGLLAICQQASADCRKAAEKFATPDTIRQEIHIRHPAAGKDKNAPKATYVLLLVPPRESVALNRDAGPPG